MTATRILVTDAEQRAALAVVRSLGRAGYTVSVCSHVERPLAAASRWTRSSFVTPDPLGDPERFSEAVAELRAREQIRTVVPVGEAATLALLQDARHHDAGIPGPDLETFSRICDKALVTRTAAELGISIPDQRVVDTREEALLVAASSRFPLVLKPARSIGAAGGVRSKVGVVHAQDRGEFRRRISGLPDQAYPLLLQQRIDGPGVGIFLLRWDARHLATFAHRRLREKPPSGGVSVYRESVPADPGLVDLSLQLLERFEWQGVAMVEYKLDAATGTPYLMEVNGRFWGSLQLAVDSGVDFPYLLVRAADGQAVSPIHEYRVGVRSRWWLGDLDHLLLRLTRSPGSLSLPPDAPGRGRVLLEFLRVWWPGDRSEVFRWGDPMPALRELRNWMADLIRQEPRAGVRPTGELGGSARNDRRAESVAR